ncbi:hypothetical protein GCM10007989_27220 [Devosia pacifica]|uniref:NlpC/P60 domain-containing protein n=1 Tax=Devosia pacifica TaxID=1335967 RepID=A0A918VW19_9HYPH|nr:hypothetical protein [Devosia pacifica]GHA30099.1 hypothetical protein GCM10007989_27220 [Devosia pacifica]
MTMIASNAPGPALIRADALIAALPSGFWRVPYDARRYPGAAAIEDVCSGANCQLFAYAVLKYFGVDVPPLRSSELWDDTSVTIRVDQPRPLDLMLFNETAEAWGAHVGVSLGDERTLHLSKAVGRPAVWTLDQFSAQPRYKCLVGIKRVVAPMAVSA